MTAAASEIVSPSAPAVEPAVEPTNGRRSPVAPPGLKGLVVADTTVGTVRGEEGYFHYRGHPAPALAAKRSFEDIAHLLLLGELPAPDAGHGLRGQLGKARAQSLEWALGFAVSANAAPVQASLLDGLAAGLRLCVDPTPTLDLDAEQRLAAVAHAVGAAPVLVAALWAERTGLPLPEPDPEASHAGDILRLFTGHLPTELERRALETYLGLTADHGFNASTFTARVITSTGASVGAALAGALGALSGPLHGGAPSRVLEMLDTIGPPERTEAYARDCFERRAKIMGFGHAVYRTPDPRSAGLKKVARELGGERVERALKIEERMLRFLAEAKPNARLVTNVEFYAAVVMERVGFAPELFTPTFALSRLVGWGAHLLEQAGDNKIIRPSARYVGPTHADG